MKKTIVQIKDIKWYEENKDEHGIVYLDDDNSHFFSRGQTPYLGKISEIVSEDDKGNIKLLADKGEWIWRKECFLSMDTKEINDDIIDVEYSETDERDSYPVSEKAIKNYVEKSQSILIEDKISINTTTEKIDSISKWGLNFIMGTVINLLTSSNENNKKEYINNIKSAITFLQNELDRIK